MADDSPLGLDSRKLSLGFANNNSPEQLTQILISAFGICLLKSITPKVATREFYFWLVSVAEQVGFSMTWSETPDRFCRDEAHLMIGMIHDMNLNTFNITFTSKV